MALIGAPGPAVRGLTAKAHTAWIALAVAVSTAGTRASLALPTWGWVTGGMLVLATVGVWLLPLGAAAGLVGLKQVMPRSSAVMLLSISIGLVAMLRGGWRSVPRGPATFFAIFVVLAIPTVHTTLAPWETIQGFPLPGTDWEAFPIRSYEILAALSLLSIAGLSLAVGYAVKTRQQFELFLVALCVGSLYPVLTGLKDSVLKTNLSYHDGSPSIMANFGHPNAFANYLIVLIPIVIAFAASTKNRLWRWGASLLGVLSVACLLLTYTRSAWIAIAVACVIAGVLAGKVRYVIALAAAVLVIGTGIGATADVIHRFSDVKITTAQTGDPGDSWQWRLTTWTEMLKSDRHPLSLTGFGFGAYSRETVEVFGLHGGRINTNLQPGWRQGFGAHNDFLNTLLETGILGMLAWTGFMVSLVTVTARIWKRTKEPLALGAFVAVFSLLISSVSGNVQSSDYTWFIAAAVVTGVVIVTRLREDDVEPVEETDEREPAYA